MELPDEKRVQTIGGTNKQRIKAASVHLAGPVEPDESWLYASGVPIRYTQGNSEPT
jgi:hypothetical protein